MYLSYLALNNLCDCFHPQARAFRVWTTQRFHQLRHRITRHVTRPASQENADSVTQPEVVKLHSLSRAVLVSVVEPQVTETQSLN